VSATVSKWEDFVRFTGRRYPVCSCPASIDGTCRRSGVRLCHCKESWKRIILLHMFLAVGYQHDLVPDETDVVIILHLVAKKTTSKKENKRNKKQRWRMMGK
jgi:hypothetical protein